jgi:hypothetical protein
MSERGRFGRRKDYKHEYSSLLRKNQLSYREVAINDNNRVDASTLPLMTIMYLYRQ